MTKIIDRTKIAAALAGALAMAGSGVVAAQDLATLQKEDSRTIEAAAKSQVKIDSLFEQSQDLLGEYRTVVAEYENLKVYNDHVQSLVDDQERQLASLQKQIDGVERTKQGIVPLMYRMIDSLEDFVKLDIPIHKEQRLARVERLRSIMGNSSVSTSEQFRQIIEAYQAELDYGSGLISYQGNLDVNGEEVAVDFFHLGRVAFLAQSLDLRNAWIYNNETDEWTALEDEYLGPLTTAIRMSRKQTAYDVVKLPIFAAENAE
ncbi:DUF3450 domain-containing protein [Idiomarina xiamenensis]|uniref:TonB system biopolymer transport component n=1 Tax=Idiomarina xiamenensis 10-D-4 TaxID=740709 RepID=K2K5I7_9GAMM|nr:DUF3450 domain-containing protein [Idiomarina xiamenensis]EKE82853.1 TonB system biopolymer transport component [Idiomarina xiamenensis 10-D-4]